MIKIKRVYDSPNQNDGVRILVDRLWPRGISKKNAEISIWAKDLAPSHNLRKWFDHDERKFNKFRIKYFMELDDKKDKIKEILLQLPVKVTLVYAAKNQKINHAICLKEYINKNFL